MAIQFVLKTKVHRDAGNVTDERLVSVRESGQPYRPSTTDDLPAAAGWLLNRGYHLVKVYTRGCVSGPGAFEYTYSKATV